MKGIFSIILEKTNKFIGEFNILGANYAAYPVEEFDIDNIFRYSFRTPYENIYLEGFNMALDKNKYIYK